jgi:hypothetical protein
MELARLQKLEGSPFQLFTGDHKTIAKQTTDAYFGRYDGEYI